MRAFIVMLAPRLTSTRTFRSLRAQPMQNVLEAASTAASSSPACRRGRGSVAGPGPAWRATRRRVGWLCALGEHGRHTSRRRSGCCGHQPPGRKGSTTTRIWTGVRMGVLVTNKHDELRCGNWKAFGGCLRGECVEYCCIGWMRRSCETDRSECCWMR